MAYNRQDEVLIGFCNTITVIIVNTSACDKAILSKYFNRESFFKYLVYNAKVHPRNFKHLLSM